MVSAQLVMSWWDGGGGGAGRRKVQAWSLLGILSSSTTRALFKNKKTWGTWVAQSVKRPTSAQVTILRSVSSSPASGSGLMARSLEPASDSVSLSLCPSPVHALSLSVPKINKR